MTRARYEPPRIGATPSTGALTFERMAPSEPIPWVLASAAANTAPLAEIPEAELAALRAAAHEQGLAEGRAAAEAELLAAHEQLQAALEAGLSEIAGFRRQVLAGYRRELGELAIAVAESVMQRELQDTAAIEALLEQAMGAVDPEERCTIHVAPATASATIAWASTHWPTATVRGDAELGPGELRLRSKSGTIDASLRERIETVRRLVLGEQEPA